MKLNNKYYKSFQKVDEDASLTTFGNFKEIEKINGK